MSANKSHGHGDGLRHGPGSEGSSSAGPLVVYAPSSEESTPLLPGKTRGNISRDGCKLVIYGLLALLAFLFLSVNLYMHFTNCPLYPSTMNDIRRGWEKEVAQHDVFQEEWGLEKQEHALIEQEWKLEQEWHEKAVARRVHEEQERQDRVRKVWDQEAREHEKEVSRRMHEEEERQVRVRKEWAHEVEKHRHEYEEMERRENQRRENERQKWRREVEDHDRIKEERRKREEEERQKLNMFWGGVTAHTCTSYATREYTAQLMNLPTTWEHRVEACMATPLEVHGISYLPKSCEDKGPGVVIGQWEINQHEPDCATFWDSYNDKGCTSPGSGKKHVTHKLENLPEKSGWREFCATTPIRFEHMHFPGAQECFQSVWGVYGQWELDDSNC